MGATECDSGRTQRRHCVHRELQIPVFGDEGSFNIVRKVTVLEVHGWDTVPGWYYPFRYYEGDSNENLKK
jgi:hypothetical protein